MPWRLENNQIEILKKNIIIKSKNLIDRFINKLGSVEESISELEHRYEKIIQRNKESKFERTIKSQRSYYLGMTYI